MVKIMTFGDRKGSARWASLGDVGSHWRLLSFGQRQSPTWERFWSEHREYWHVDDPEGRKIRPWFWETFTEESFLAEARKQYADLVNYYKQWNGLCTVGEVVTVVPLSPTTIVLSKNWKGSVTDHSDLEVELHRTYTGFVVPGAFACSIFSYGTITVLPGSMGAQMGERIGTSRVSHNQASLTHAQDLSIALDPNGKRIRIWDAQFEVLRR